jgi:hypothetical protein
VLVRVCPAIAGKSAGASATMAAPNRALVAWDIRSLVCFSFLRVPDNLHHKRRQKPRGSGVALQLGRGKLVLLVGNRSIRAAFPTPSCDRIGDVSSISSHTVDLL